MSKLLATPLAAAIVLTAAGLSEPPGPRDLAAAGQAPDRGVGKGAATGKPGPQKLALLVGIGKYSRGRRSPRIGGT